MTLYLCSVQYIHYHDYTSIHVTEVRLHYFTIAIIPVVFLMDIHLQYQHSILRLPSPYRHQQINQCRSYLKNFQSAFPLMEIFKFDFYFLSLQGFLVPPKKNSRKKGKAPSPPDNQQKSKLKAWKLIPIEQFPSNKSLLEEPKNIEDEVETDSCNLTLYVASSNLDVGWYKLIYKINK